MVLYCFHYMTAYTSLSGFTSADTAATALDISTSLPSCIRTTGGPIPSRCRQSVDYGLSLLWCTGLALLTPDAQVTKPCRMPIPAQFAVILERDTRTMLLTPVADVPTRKMTAIYRFGEWDERPAGPRRRHLLQWPSNPCPYIRYTHNSSPTYPSPPPPHYQY